MRANCSTCLELLSPNDELVAPPCGHVLHHICLVQWFETGKNSCPQCRQKCRDNQLRRIYFSEAAGGDELVSGSDLQNKCDNLAFELRCRETELKRATEDRDTLKAQNVGLRAEFKEVEQRLDSVRAELRETKTQAKFFEGERKKYVAAKKEAEQLKRQLELYKNVEEFVQGSVEDVNAKLHSIGDFSQTSRELSIIIAALKKEMKAQVEDKVKLKNDVKVKMRQITDLKATLSIHTAETSDLLRKNAELRSDLEYSEEERRSLEKKLEALQAALDSPSGNPRHSALTRMLSEHPAPMNMTLDEIKENVGTQEAVEVKTKVETNGSSPFLKTKSCSIVGMAGGRKRNANEEFNIMKKKKLESARSFGELSEQFYNGFGGHAKADDFPRPSGLKMKVKKGGKVVPKNVQTINKYFGSLETP